VLKCFSHFYVQNETSRILLETIGITEVSVVGDTRFDRVLQIKEKAKVIPAIEKMTGSDGGQRSKVFVAGSSWQPDEEIFIPWLNEHKEWKLIIAPHVIGEEHLQQIEHLLAGRKVRRYTTIENTEHLDSLDALIIDCFGLLSSIYRYADVTYVGGGFGVGIHNTLEAAVWGVPVIFGPNNQRFQEAQGLKACGGGMEIHGADDFRSIMQRFLTEPQSIADAGNSAGEFVKSMTGATAKILSDIKL
jgi:3-deoxy-D-manno-octulosonic-acid transferase